MRFYTTVIIALMLGFFSVGWGDGLQSVKAQEPARPPGEFEAARGENYIVYAMRKTELQDFLLGASGKHHREDYTVYVIVDGSSLFTPEGLLDLSKLEWDELASEVRKLRKDERSVAVFHVLAGGPGDHKALTWLFEGFARSRCRFNHFYWRVSSHRGAFWERIEQSQADVSSEGAGEEAGIGNDLVKVFPVQTFLSRFHSDNANCVVRILPQLVAQERVGLHGVIRASMLKFVPTVDVSSKKRLLVLGNYHTDASETIDWLRTEGFGRLADKLGYDEVTDQFAEYSFLLKKAEE
ncbi:hypothetical protein [Aureliella helgolandensis]|uniref:Uncharacterized protein n=1 Tax=Aureliella helgolandensis TaxID=2527968 RepID=A0A518GAU5_9BACT|nr:hypothetical protein [Aureliella helgolandensis]QDV25725.1 hypothetical protein Q31a_40520 [Aureliella helgolandensis]